MKKSVLSVAKELGGTGGVADLLSDMLGGGNTYFVRQHEQSHLKRFELFMIRKMRKKEREEERERRRERKMKGENKEEKLGVPTSTHFDCDPSNTKRATVDT
jgi:hypothetical protein